MLRRPIVRLAAVLAAAVLLASCTIVIISGPSVVAVDDVVTYVLEVGSSGLGGADIELFVIADVPVGWALLSATFDGTIDGVPTTGSGTVVASSFCDSTAGGVLPGYQRLYVMAGPFAQTSALDTGTTTLEFDADSQPAGEFQVFFRFAGTGSSPQCGTAAVLTINEDSFTFLSFVQALFDDAGGVDGLDYANSVALSPDGEHLLATAENDDSVAVFGRDAATGELSFTQVLINGMGVDGLVDASGVALSPDGLHAYATGAASDAIVSFSRDAMTGELTLIETLYDGTDGIDGLDDVQSVTISPAGDSVYTTSFEDAIAVFSRDAMTGELTFVEALFDGVGGVDGLDGVLAVAVSPDGLHAYAVGSIEDSLVHFSRDGVTGELTFVEALFDGAGGVDGLEGVRSLAISPDGAHIYTAASGFPDSIGVFSRDGVTGAPTFVQALANGSGGLTGLESGGSVAVHPSGSHVFFSGVISVHAFARDAATGMLTLVESQFDGDPPNEGMDGVVALAVAPDGSHLYAASFRSDSLAGFGVGQLFADGFESGDTTSWSSSSE